MVLLVDQPLCASLTRDVELWRGTPGYGIVNLPAGRRPVDALCSRNTLGAHFQTLVPHTSNGAVKVLMLGSHSD
jgi:hypothetical protein